MAASSDPSCVTLNIEETGRTPLIWKYANTNTHSLLNTRTRTPCNHRCVCSNNLIKSNEAVLTETERHRATVREAAADN